MKFGILVTVVLLAVVAWYHVVAALFPIPEPLDQVMPPTVQATATLQETMTPTSESTTTTTPLPRANNRRLLNMPDVQAILVEQGVIGQSSDVRCTFQKDWSYHLQDFYFCTPREDATILDPRTGQVLPWINVNAHTGRLFWNDQLGDAPLPTTVPDQLPDPGEIDHTFI